MTKELDSEALEQKISPRIIGPSVYTQKLNQVASTSLYWHFFFFETGSLYHVTLAVLELAM